jgi:RNA polymerase sigma-70 factor (ECF subfamily)
MKEFVDHRVRANVAADPATQEFTRFYQWGKPQLFYHALALVGDRSIAEDLTQDALLRLFAEIKGGAPVRSALHWTHRVVRNLALNHMEHTRVIERTVYDVDIGSYQEIVASPGESAEQELIAKERLKMLHDSLARLVSPERECLLLFAEGCSFRQIADQTDLSYAAAVATVRRALRRIRQQMRACGH